MRALVTGATGFLGSALTRRLVESGEEVAILRRRDSDVWRIQDLLPRVVQIECDLSSLSGMEGPVLDFAPDAIFHLAWHGVSNRLRNDESQIDKNLTISLSLLRLALKSSCRAWIGLGSQAEYGPHNQMLDETTPTTPVTLYGTVKLCTWLLAKQLLSEARIRLAWLRLFSIYGPGDNPDWMIPQLIGALLRRERPSLTLGEQKWDYLYVTDAAEAVYRAAACEEAQGAFNLGSGEVHTIRSIVEAIRDRIDPALPLGFGEINYRSDQSMHFQADISKLRETTGWTPHTTLEEGLQRTIEWYKTQQPSEHR